MSGSVVELLAAVVITGLGGWRAAAMLSYEMGPFDIFERFRLLFRAPAGEPQGQVERLLACTWCSSVWTTAALSAMWWGLGWWLPAAALAAMAVAVMAERVARP